MKVVCIKDEIISCLALCLGKVSSNRKIPSAVEFYFLVRKLNLLARNNFCYKISIFRKIFVTINFFFSKAIQILGYPS